MSWRVVVISSRAKLELKLGYLVIRSTETKRILLDEISVLLIENTGCVVSSALLCELQERKVCVIFCDFKHNPLSQLIPLHGSYDSSERIRIQLNWKQETKDLVWKAIIEDKIRKQAGVIHRHNPGNDWERILGYSEGVAPGDATNREAHAAKVYFNALLGCGFSRNTPSELNSALDYGYTIVLSAFNRAVAACGYMAQVGIFHHNVFNPFNLSSDLMEPFRPLVDEKVLSLPIDEPLGSESKMEIVRLLNDEVTIKGQNTTVLGAIGIYAKSIFDALESGNPELVCTYEV